MVPLKLAYFILCHKAPDHVIRLVDRLRDADSYFVIHVDKRAEPDVFAALRYFSEKTPGRVYLCKQFRCYWGGFGIVEATISCIQKAVALRLPFDRAVLLSGQDYPIKTVA